MRWARLDVSQPVAPASATGRRCDPLWPIEGGHFAPMCLDMSRSSALLEQVLERLASVAPVNGVSLYLRGGVLEAIAPHPRADIDVMVVGPWPDCQMVAAEVSTRLADLGRPVEAVPLTLDQLHVLPVFRMLVQFRARLVGGGGVTLPPLALTADLLRSLWAFHAPFLLARRLAGPVSQRLVNVKHALRAVGVLGLFDGRYTRDLPTCLAWAAGLVPDAEGVLWQALADLEDDDPPPLDLRPALLALELAFDARLRGHRPKPSGGVS